MPWHTCVRIPPSAPRLQHITLAWSWCMGRSEWRSRSEQARQDGGHIRARWGLLALGPVPGGNPPLVVRARRPSGVRFCTQNRTEGTLWTGGGHDWGKPILEVGAQAGTRARARARAKTGLRRACVLLVRDMGRGVQPSALDVVGGLLGCPVACEALLSSPLTMCPPDS